MAKRPFLKNLLINLYNNNTMRKFLFTILSLITLGATAQPKIAINIVIGGMKASDIARYADNFSDDGFKRLTRDGAIFTECYTDFIPTSDYTALATLATGALPSMHGISATKWYDRADKNRVVELCRNEKGELTTEHFSAQTLAGSVTDSQRGAKSITIAHNPLSAMMLAGDSAECYWINERGDWQSIPSYSKVLPAWVTAHNNIGFNRIFVMDTWFGKLSKSKYHNSHATDIAVYDIYAKNKNTNSKKETLGWASKLHITPAGNGALFDFAKQAVDQLLTDKDTKGIKCLNICIDVSRNIIERYGFDSIEYEDMLYCLDTTIAEFLAHLEKRELKSSDFLLTITSDHGSGKATRSTFNPHQAEVILNAFLSAKYGQGDWVLSCHQGSIYLNRDLIYSKKLSLDDVQSEAATFAVQFRGVASAVTATALQSGAMPDGVMKMMQKGFYPRRSGDIIYTLMPDYSEDDDDKGIFIGSPYNYDCHVPLIFYGGNIASTAVSRKISTTAIAPTIAAILGVEKPDCSEGEVLSEVIY